MLPSVAALAALRWHAKPSRASRPFIGFGNPLLVGQSGTDKRAWSSQTCPAVGRSRSARVAGAPAHRFTGLFRGGVADVAAVRQQSPLPETADELCAVARLLGANVDAEVYLGDRAREVRIKALSADGALAKARVVHFATHGLLAGETKWFNKGSLHESALSVRHPGHSMNGPTGIWSAMTQVATVNGDIGRTVEMGQKGAFRAVPVAFRSRQLMRV